MSTAPAASPSLPERPPFAVRARVLSPLGSGGLVDLADGRVDVDAFGRIERVARWSDDGADDVVDARPLVVLPGFVDLHVHLPQLTNAGLGYGLDLLTWLDRDIFPLERAWVDPEVAARDTAAAFRAFAAAGTTTVLAYGAVYEESLDAAFRAAEAHGIRAVLGKVMMDRVTYDERQAPGSPELTELSLRQSADLCSRWHGRDAGRLRYAFTPRFAVSCSFELLRESAAMARASGATWQTHVSEDSGEIAEVARLFPDADGYLDVYDRAGALGPTTVLAHAVHLSAAEIARVAETRTRIAHCPASNLFLASGIMPLGRFLDAGITVGVGSDVAAGPELSIPTVLRVGAYSQQALAAGDGGGSVLSPIDWLRLGTLEGARSLGLDGVTGSLEVGKEADLILVDPAATSVTAGQPVPTDAEDLASRLIFRAHPSMVRAAYVRGRRLEGPT